MAHAGYEDELRVEWHSLLISKEWERQMQKGELNEYHSGDIFVFMGGHVLIQYLTEHLWLSDKTDGRTAGRGQRQNLNTLL